MGTQIDQPVGKRRFNEAPQLLRGSDRIVQSIFHQDFFPEQLCVYVLSKKQTEGLCFDRDSVWRSLARTSWVAVVVYSCICKDICKCRHILEVWLPVQMGGVDQLLGDIHSYWRTDSGNNSLLCPIDTSYGEMIQMTLEWRRMNLWLHWTVVGDRWSSRMQERQGCFKELLPRIIQNSFLEIGSDERH